MRITQTAITFLATFFCIANPLFASANTEITEACKAYAEDLKRITLKNSKFSGDNYVISIWDIEAAPINPNTPTTGKPIIAACTSTALWANDGQTYIDYNIEYTQGDEIVTIMYLPHGF